MGGHRDVTATLSAETIKELCAGPGMQATFEVPCACKVIDARPMPDGSVAITLRPVEDEAGNTVEVAVGEPAPTLDEMAAMVMDGGVVRRRSDGAVVLDGDGLMADKIGLLRGCTVEVTTEFTSKESSGFEEPVSVRLQGSCEKVGEWSEPTQPCEACVEWIAAEVGGVDWRFDANSKEVGDEG